MKKNKSKQLQAKVQALSNQLNINRFNKKEKEYIDINDSIKKDITKTIVLMIVSFGILFLIKYLDSNLFFNKFF